MKKTKKLYRYRTLNENELHAINDDYIWLSGPTSFNDPFDCQLFVECYKREAESLPLYLAKNQSGEDSILARYYRGYYDNVVRKNNTDCGIACFSEVNDGILLWAHYGDSHRGICLEYSFPEDTEGLFSLARPVNYCDDYPDMHFSDYLDQGIERTMAYLRKISLTKNSIWAYEKEWRIIIPGQTGKANFHEGYLSSVYVGCNADREQIEKLLNVVHSKHTPPRVYKCRTSIQSYTLEFTQLLEEDMSSLQKPSLPQQSSTEQLVNTIPAKKNNIIPTNFGKNKTDREMSLDREIASIVASCADLGKYWHLSEDTLLKVMRDIGALDNERDFVVKRVGAHVNAAKAIADADQTAAVVDGLLDAFQKSKEKWDTKNKEFDLAKGESLLNLL